MKNINFLTVLALLQFFHLLGIGYFQFDILSSKTAAIIWCIYFIGNLNIFVVLMCADVIYSKIKNDKL